MAESTLCYEIDFKQSSGIFERKVEKMPFEHC